MPAKSGSGSGRKAAAKPLKRMGRPLKGDSPAEHVLAMRFTSREKALLEAVSYTHLTLPTNREV